MNNDYLQGFNDGYKKAMEIKSLDRPTISAVAPIVKPVQLSFLEKPRKKKYKMSYYDRKKRSEMMKKRYAEAKAAGIPWGNAGRKRVFTPDPLDVRFPSNDRSKI